LDGSLQPKKKSKPNKTKRSEPMELLLKTNPKLNEIESRELGFCLKEDI